MQNTSSITRLIIKFGLAKDDKQAPIILIAIAVLAVVATFVFWPKSNDGNRVPPPITLHQVVETCA